MTSYPSYEGNEDLVEIIQPDGFTLDELKKRIKTTIEFLVKEFPLGSLVYYTGVTSSSGCAMSQEYASNVFDAIDPLNGVRWKQGIVVSRDQLCELRAISCVHL